MDMPSARIGPMSPGALAVTTIAHHDGSLICVRTPDRPALLADLAGGLALAGLQIRSARVASTDGVASTLWETTGSEIDAARLELRLRNVLAGKADLTGRLSAAAAKDPVPPQVRVLTAYSTTATVLEVRARDRRGLVWSVCRAIAGAGCEIRSAHLSTFGPEARDVFYVVDATGGALAARSATELCRRVTEALR